MKHNLKLIIFSLTYLLNTHSFLQAHETKKIVGLMQIRNEEVMLEQHLRALACYTDAIVIINDASTDGSSLIIDLLKEELNIEKVITHIISSRENGNESDNHQLLLETGRSIGGTHFIVIDADEMFTANCLKDNFLRNKILALNPGDSIELCWIQLWRSVNQYRYDISVWTHNYKKFIFCDCPIAKYEKKWLNAVRVPPLNGTAHRIHGYDHGLLHFQFVNWNNLLIKQAWYRCLERIRNPQQSIKDINELYAPTKNENNLGLQTAPTMWLNGYDFFDATIYQQPEQWRTKQILSWFDEYGIDYFKDLDIWDIDWEQ